MTVFDYAVLIIIGLSVFLGIMRGLVREVLGLVGWVAAFFIAKTYSSQLVPMMPIDIPTDGLKILAAFLVVFLATLLAASLLAIALSAIFNKIGLGWLNRLLGIFFGLTRGVVIVCIIVFMAGLTDIPKDSRWRDAMFSAPIEALVLNVLPWLPESIAKYVKYD
jgi:membrane protein required for colicin V production